VESWAHLEYAVSNQWPREADIYNPDTMLKMLGRWYEAAGVPFSAREFHT
jgi:hypothetical protein